jgi:pimeloyl-ACP methyl ester carboxylesterase
VHLATPAVDLDTHITDVINVITCEELEAVVLVGWSYSGMVVTGVLDRIPKRLAHVVYLDAEVPRDGESEFDVAGPEFRAQMEQSARAGDGWQASLGTAEELEAFFRSWLPDPGVRRWFATKLASNAQPIKTFSQPLHLSNTVADLVPRTFIRCPVDGSVWAHVYDPTVARLRGDRRWRVRELASNHVAPIADPELVAHALLDVVDVSPAVSPRARIR